MNIEFYSDELPEFLKEFCEVPSLQRLKKGEQKKMLTENQAMVDSHLLKPLQFWQSVQSLRQALGFQRSKRLKLRGSIPQRNLFRSIRQRCSLTTLIVDPILRQNRACRLYGKNLPLFPFLNRGKDHIWTRKSKRILGEEVTSMSKKVQPFLKRAGKPLKPYLSKPQQRYLK